MMHEQTELLLLRAAAFLKIVFVDKVMSCELAAPEAEELLNAVYQLLAAENKE